MLFFLKPTLGLIMNQMQLDLSRECVPEAIHRRPQELCGEDRVGLFTSFPSGVLYRVSLGDAWLSLRSDCPGSAFSVEGTEKVESAFALNFTRVLCPQRR